VACTIVDILKKGSKGRRRHREQDSSIQSCLWW